MIAHYEIDQKSEEWFKIKYGKIGGTRASGLFVKSETLLNELIAENCEDFEYDEDCFESSDMQRGNELEPEARTFLNKFLGINLIECGWLQCKEINILGISPDGITECETIQCEVKCFGAKKHIDVLRKNEIPKEHLLQCVHAFTVNPKLEKLYFIAYRPENNLKPAFIYEINRHTVLDIGLKKQISVEVIGKRGTIINPKIENVTDYKTVQELVEIAKVEAIKIQLEIEKEINNLNF